MKRQLKALALAVILIASPVIAQVGGGIYNPGNGAGGGSSPVVAPFNSNLVDPRSSQFGANTCTGYYGIATSEIVAAGTGYVTGDTFTLDAAIPGANIATGHVTTVSGSTVTGYTLDNAGGAYNSAVGNTLNTQATSGTGSGLTIKIDSASSSGHDDTAAIHNALVYATAKGWGVMAPTGCWINNLTTPVNSTIIGTALAPTAGYGVKNLPTWFIWGAPSYGINTTGSTAVALEGFEVSGQAGVGTFGSTACIGGSSTVPFGPRNYAIRMAAKGCNVGLGTPDGTGSLILWTSVSSDWGANNTAGVWGPFSDYASINDQIASTNNGVWISASGGGFAHITSGRYEYINQYAVRLDAGGGSTQIDNLQTDRAGLCAIAVNNTGEVNVTGSAFKAAGLAGTLTVTGAANNGSGLIRLTVSGYGSNANGGGTPTSGLVTGDVVNISGVTGTTEANGTWTLTVIDGTHIDLQTSTFTHTYASGGLGGVNGKDAYVCLNNSSDFHSSNVGYYGYSAGPTLSAAYVVDSVTSDRLSFDGGSAQQGATGIGGYQIALTNFHNSTPAHVRIDIPANVPFINDQTTFSFNANGGMGLGTTNPKTTAILDLSSSALGLSLPTWTTGTRPTGSAGMLGYNSTLPGLEAFVSGTWGQLYSGNLPISAFNSGTGASSTTYWRGDGTWATPAGTGGGISGPGTSTNTGVPRWSGTSGTALLDSQVLIDGSNNLTTPGTLAITSASATAMVVGPNGATNPVLTIDGSATTSATGVSIKGAASGGSSFITATNAGTNGVLEINGKGSGIVSISSNANGVSLSQGAHQFFGGAYFFTSTFRGFTANPYMQFVGTAATSLTASTEAPAMAVNWGQTVTHATGNITTQRDTYFTPSTHAFSAASTITNTYGLSLTGAPIAGANATLTNSSTLQLAAAAVNGGGAVTNSYGISVNANTGATNNYIASFNGAAGEVLNIRTDGHVSVLGTNAGSTGAQTINQPSGKVQFAAAASSLVVTDSLVTTSSICFATVQAVDLTLKTASCAPGSGSFTLTGNAAATGTTAVGFLVIN